MLSKPAEAAKETIVPAVGVDIGRTKIAAGIVTSSGRVVDRRVTPAPSHFDEEAVTAQAALIIKELLRERPGIRCVGIGTPEVVEWSSGHVLKADEPGATFPLRSRIEDSVDLPTVVDSDANMAAWAEYRSGAAVGAINAILITVGTGVGGGIIIDQQIYRGSMGFAGEIGHVVVNPFGESCGCGNAGCLEAMTSGTALARMGRAVAYEDPDGLIARLGGGHGGVTGEVVFEAAKLGDKKAVALFDEIGYWLGLGLASLILIFDPDVVVVGGGLARTGDLLMVPAGVSARNNSTVRGGRIPAIALAEHHAWAGLVGAAQLAWDVQSAERR